MPVQLAPFEMCVQLARSAQCFVCRGRGDGERLNLNEETVEGNMAGKLACLLILGATCASGPARAQQKAQPSSDSGGTPAKIKCHEEPNVSITSDAEQALPLRLVAIAACNESVTVLSDLQGYTVKVRTASGKIGYVTRYEIAADSPVKEWASAPSASGGANANSSQAQGQQAKPLAEPSAAPDEKGSTKPRVYISDSESWTEIGGFGQPSTAFGGNGYAGYNPDMVDIYQDFTSDCPAVVVVQEKSKADYAILFDKGTGKKGFTGFGGLVKVNKVTVIARSGETLLSQALRSEDATVKLACDAVTQRQTASGTGQTGKAVQ